MAFNIDDLVPDTPTNNFATFNPLFTVSSPLYQGNLYAYGTTSGARSAFSTFEIPTTGKWYVEILLETKAAPQAGIGRKEAIGSGSSTAVYGYYENGTTGSPYALYDDSSQSAAASPGDATISAGFNITAGHITRIYIDADKNQLWMGNNTTWATSDNTLGSVPTFGNGGTFNGSTPLNFADGYHIFVSNGNTADKWFLNAGQDPTFGGNKIPTKVYTDARGLGRFYYQPPEGALALCSRNIGDNNYKSAPTSYVSDETNTKILTYNGNVEQVPYSPYATDGYSIYFNGVDSYTQLTPHSDFVWNTDDFTIEFWIYMMENQDTFLWNRGRGNNQKDETLYYNSTDKSLTYSTYNGSSNPISMVSPDNSISLGKWHHVAVVYQHNTTLHTMYIDGVSVVTDTSGATYITSATWGANGDISSISNPEIRWGRDNTTVYGAAHYVSGLRVTTQALYTTTFTPPTSITNTGANVKFLTLSTERTIKDSSSSSHTIQLYGTPSIEAWSPYTTEAIQLGTAYRTPEDAHEIGSFSFDGNSQQVEFATSADFELTGDATIEMWVYLNSAIAGNTPLFGYGNIGGSDYFVLFINAAGKLQWYQHNSLSGTESTASVGIGQWHHIALVKNGKVITVYNNGVEVITSSYDGTSGSGPSYYTSNRKIDGSIASFPTGHPLVIGSWASNTNYGSNGHLNGYIADYRVVNGTAVYTGAFTPPSEKLGLTQSVGTNISAITSGETKLLLQPYKSYDADNLLTSNFSYNKDSSPIPKSLTYVGNTKVVDFSPYKSGANGSFSFPSSSDYVEVAGSSTHTDFEFGTDAWSIEFWINPKLVNPSTRKMIFGFSTCTDDNDCMGFYSSSASSAHAWEITRSTTNYHWKDASVIANQWYHIAITYEGNSNGKMRVWRDGVLLDHDQYSTNNSATSEIDDYAVNWTVKDNGDSVAPDFNPTGNLMLNRGHEGSNGVGGYITDFRVVKDHLVYTTSGTGRGFTPPYDELTTTGGSYSSSNNISNPTSSSETVLLLQPGALASSDPAKKPFEHFKAVKYVGDGDALGQQIATGLAADFVWIKNRDAVIAHVLFDSVRGVSKVLQSNAAGAEYTDSNTLTNFGSSSFSVGSNDNAINQLDIKYIAWCFRAGGAPTADYASGNDTTANGCFFKDGSAVTTSNAFSGSYTITPTRASIGTKQGFSIIKYSSVSATPKPTKLPHGLGKKPEFIITKCLDTASTSWVTVQTILDSDFYLNGTGARFQASGTYFQITADADTITFAKTDSAYSNNGTKEYIVYAFTSIDGYSKFGSYIGTNHQDKGYHYLGFKPAFIMIKCIDNTTSQKGGWAMFDNARSSTNPIHNCLQANSSAVETTTTTPTTTQNQIDFLSNGFFIRCDDSNSKMGNVSGHNYIYIAFAEAPVNFSNAR